MSIDFREHDSAVHHPRVLADGSYRADPHELGTLRMRWWQDQVSGGASAEGLTTLTVGGE